MRDSQEDRIIAAFLRSLGPWRDTVVIGGGYALFIYTLYFGEEALHRPIWTRDIDSLLPRRVKSGERESIATYLKNAGFVSHFRDRGIPATEAYSKEIDGIEVEVEFITDNAACNGKGKNVVIAGVTAQPLSYLELSVEACEEFETYSGERGKVVAPEAWLFHKGLTFTRRRNLSKRLKDLYGIWFVASQLGFFSREVCECFIALAEAHTKWFETFCRQLRNWMESASPSEWSALEDQDPSGRLRKERFKSLVERLIAKRIQ